MDTDYRKQVALWIPHRFISPAGIDVFGFVDEINALIRSRGLVLWDGQLLSKTISDVAVSKGALPTERVSVDGVEGTFLRPLKVGPHSEVIVEEGSGCFDVPSLRYWGPAQAEHFGLTNPHQMAESPDDYSWSHLMTLVDEPFLSADESIIAVLDGQKDGRHFYCTCHHAEVVYTTRQRLVCMACGALHAVLETALTLSPVNAISAREWRECFDPDGARCDEEIALHVVDFQEVEHAQKIWATSQWEESARQFIFFARSSPEEIEEAIRGTEADPSIFLEAGWTPFAMPPPPAFQIADNSHDIDLIENAAHALRDGVGLFLRSRTEASGLVNAVPHLFRAVELLLKARLEQLDPSGLADHPNNPTVLKRLKTHGVALTSGDVDVITRLRRLRNQIQHGSATFGQRAGLSLARQAICFLDRFVLAELGLWIGDVVGATDWPSLLLIPEIAATADNVREARVEAYRGDPRATIEPCEHCGTLAMVRPDPRGGAACVYSRRVASPQEPC